MIIVDYDRSRIFEYILYTLDQPLFSREYSTFGKKLDSEKGI